MVLVPVGLDQQEPFLLIQRQPLLGVRRLLWVVTVHSADLMSVFNLLDK